MLKPKNKICVYAIAKNEEAFVDRWAKSMKEADYVVVLDTGSEDSTIDKLKSYDFTVEQKIINPWRFDVARNESLKLVPEDANILVCTDLDEVFEPGWAETLRKRWINGRHVRCHYKYAWSHDPSDNPGRIFFYDKIHDRNWSWKYPVHELLDSEYAEEYVDSHTLNLFDKIFLHHYPDDSKSRASYLPLLELRRDENPEDHLGRLYLAHEYHYRGLCNESNTELMYLITNHANDFSTLELASCYLFLGDNYKHLEDYGWAATYYQRAITVDPTFREPYLYLAEIYNYLEQWEMAIGTVKQALRTSIRHWSWLERDDSWNEKPYDILAIAYYYLKDYEKSYYNVIKAYKRNPYNQRVIDNKEFIENALYNN